MNKILKKTYFSEKVVQMVVELNPGNRVIL